MYICSCNALSDTDLRRKARDCDGSAADCYALLGATPICGKCLDNAQAIIDRARAPRMRAGSVGGAP